VFEPGVQHFLDSVKLGTPHFFHVVEAVIHLPIQIFEAAIDIIETGFHVMPKIAQTGVIDQDPY